ncbi:type II 3-dehydroquinate dehydratase [Burkholderia sp. LMG 32019]|uniref:type II 3-dehydroquinate dehydratase n=1 Tax=Burkholderia sp. LMG 32019 TaxID=3158173 RepID=UPI003C2E4DBE
MRTLLMVNGPNLGRLGSRKPDIYGTATLHDITRRLEALAEAGGWSVVAFQSNHEGEIIDCLEARRDVDALILNPGALMMNGWALRDALEDFPAPWIEVHLSNIWSRESFRHTSILAPLAAGVIAGLGSEGYLLAATGLMRGAGRPAVEPAAHP